LVTDRRTQRTRAPPPPPPVDPSDQSDVPQYVHPVQMKTIVPGTATIDPSHIRRGMPTSYSIPAGFQHSMSSAPDSYETGASFPRGSMQGMQFSSGGTPFTFPQGFVQSTMNPVSTPQGFAQSTIKPVSTPPGFVQASSSSIVVNPTTMFNQSTSKPIPRMNSFTPSPTVSNPTPVVSNPTPVVSNPTPVVSNPTQVVSNPTPAVSNPTPVVSNPTPVAHNPTPVAHNPTPVVSTPTPVVSTPTPVVSTPTPVVSNSNPVVSNPTYIPTDTATVSHVSPLASSMKNQTSDNIVNTQVADLTKSLIEALTESVRDIRADHDTKSETRFKSGMTQHKSVTVVHYSFIGGKGWQRLVGYSKGSDCQPITCLMEGRILGITVTHSGIGRIAPTHINICTNVKEGEIPADRTINSVLVLTNELTNAQSVTAFDGDDADELIWQSQGVFLQRRDQISLYADNLIGANIELYIEYKY
jgi:hypothetical protein